jgi:hypothetical protein
MLDMVTEAEAFDLLGNTVCVPVIKEIAKKIGRYYIATEDDREVEAV